LSNTNLLSVPFDRTSFGAHTFSIAAPIGTIWSSLTPSLQMCSGPDTFRHHYFPQALQPT